MQLKQIYRTSLATLMVAITPCTLLMWMQLHVSGATWNPDGSRNQGHLIKYVSEAPYALLGGGIVVLLVGAAVIWVVGKFGAVTAYRLIAAGAATGGAIALGMFSLAAAGSTPGNYPALAPSVFMLVGGSLFGVLISLEYSAVAGLPFNLKGINGQVAPTLDLMILLSATAATGAALIWIVRLVTFAAQHPCNCG